MFWLHFLINGNVLIQNMDSNNEIILSVCTILNIVSGATYQISLVQRIFISLNRYLVITENRFNLLHWNGNRKYIMFCVMWILTLVLNASVIQFGNHMYISFWVYKKSLKLWYRIFGKKCSFAIYQSFAISRMMCLYRSKNL